VEILNDWLQPDDIGIEWGTGQSTMWLAKHVARLISIEHDKQWYEHVKQLLKDNGINNVELHFAPLTSTDQSSESQKYLKIPQRQPEQSMDFFLVDGKLRDRCVDVAMQLLKPGGLLIIDNAERYLPSASRAPESIGNRSIPSADLWYSLIQRLESWRCIWTSNGVFDTALFVRPPFVDS
jgi:predicted O-methyltransferase YrrM